MIRFQRPNKKAIPYIIASFILLVSFQNCKENTGINLKTTTSSSSTDPNATTVVTNGGTTGGTGGTTTTPPTSSPTPTPTVNPCPASAMGSPTISDIVVQGSGTTATSVTAVSGYSNMSGNVSSSPVLEVSLLATNVTPADVCDQSAQVRCNITVNAGATGVLWGTTDRVAIANNDLECVLGSQNIDVDVAGKAPTTRPNKSTIVIRPKDQAPDLTATTHVCMQGTATVKVTLRNIYNKNSAEKTFTVNLNNGCPSETKLNADTEAEAQGALGESLSISGTRAAVLSSGMDDKLHTIINVGGVRIYEKVGSTWTYKTTVLPPYTELEADKKAAAVALNGNNLFIGNAAVGTNAGKVWLFQFDGSNWNYATTLSGPAGSKFGSSLAFNGTHLFVGAPNGSGAVYIYSLSGSTLSAVSTITGPDANSDFGAAIAVSGTKLAIGAPGSAVNTTTTGNFHYCDLTTISAPTCTKWALASGKLGTETIPATSKLGSAIAIKGNLILVGAKGWYLSTVDPAPAIRNGLVGIIDISNSSVQILKGGNEEIFGSAVDFATNTFFVGAKEALGKRGYVDQFTTTTSAVPTRKFRYFGLDQGPMDRFGQTLGVSGSDLIVGAPLDQEAGYSTAGSITFFGILSP